MAIGLIGGLGQGLVQASSSLLQAKEDERKRAIEEEDRAKRNKLFELQYQEQKRKAAQDKYGDEDGASRMMDFLQNDAIAGVKKIFEPYNQPTPTPSPAPTPGGNVPTQTPGTATVTTQGAIPGMQAPPQQGLVPSASSLRLAGIQPKYEAMKKRAAEAVARIEAETANDPEARKMRLAAYHRSLETSPEFKEVMAGLNGYVEDEKASYLDRRAMQGIAAITSGNPDAIKQNFGANLKPGTRNIIVSDDGRTEMPLTYMSVYEAVKDDPTVKDKAKVIRDAYIKDVEEWRKLTEAQRSRDDAERRARKSRGGAQSPEEKQASAIDLLRAKGMVKRYEDDYRKIKEMGLAAESAILTLDQMESALKEGARTGFGANTINTLKRAASAIGINISGTSEAEVFRALSNQLTLKAKNAGGTNQMPGSMSNSDRDFLRESVANASDTKEGNMKLISITRALFDRQRKVYALALSYAKRRGGYLDEGWDEKLAAWTRKNPLADAVASGQQEPSRTRTTTSQSQPSQQAGTSNRDELKRLARQQGGE